MQSTRGTIIISTSMIMLGDRKPTLTWLLLYLFFIIFGSFLNIVGRYVGGAEGATYRPNPAGLAQRVRSVRSHHGKPASAPYEAGFPSQKAGSKSSIATALGHFPRSMSTNLQQQHWKNGCVLSVCQWERAYNLPLATLSGMALNSFLCLECYRASAISNPPPATRVPCLGICTLTGPTAPPK